MKIVATLFALVFSALMLGCEEAKEESPKEPKTTVLVFVDKSPSTDKGELDALKRKYNHWRKVILKNDIRNAEDQIMVSYIYQNTNAAGNCFVLQYSPPVHADVSASETKQKRAEIQWKNETTSYDRSYDKRFLNKFESVGHEGTSTFVHGSIPVIARALRSLGPNEVLKVYFFSDMIEWSDIRQMEFESGDDALTSITKARELAKEDIQRVIETLHVQPNALSSLLEVTIISPTTVLQSKEYKFLPEYWSTVFQELGGPTPSFH